MVIRFLEPALAELEDAAGYYDQAQSGLGDRFYAEVDVALAFVAEFPEGCSLRANGARRCNLKRFPYFLIYQIEDGEIIVAAVAHVHRRPEYWCERLEK